MFNVVDQGRDEMVRSGRVPTVNEAEIRDLVQTKSFADFIVKTFLSRTKFIVMIQETVANSIDRAVN